MTGQVMSRWWAPEKPSETPDEVTRAALLQLGDGSDQTSVLLALHRAAAASVHSRVEAGLIDELGLVQAMAGAREQVADDAVDTLTDEMGREAAEALISSYCDQAEHGAHYLFRAAVAKGVAPPMAARRAAAVYGVPKNAMRTYFSVATSPKTHPSSLDDAADRTLMAHLMRLERNQESVAKAQEMTPAEKEEFERLHPRSDDGQFAPKGQGSTSGDSGLDLTSVLERSREVASRAKSRSSSRPSVRVKEMEPAKDSRRKLLESLGITDMTPAGLRDKAPWQTGEDEQEKAVPETKTPAPEKKPADKPRLTKDKPRLTKDKPRLTKDKPRLLQDKTGSKVAPEKITPEKVGQGKVVSEKVQQQRIVAGKVAHSFNESRGTDPTKRLPVPAQPSSAVRPGLLDRVTNAPPVDSVFDQAVVNYMPWGEWSNLRGRIYQEASERGNDPKKMARLGNLFSMDEPHHLQDNHLDIGHAMDAARAVDAESIGDAPAESKPVTFSEALRGQDIPLGSASAQDALHLLALAKAEELETEMQHQGYTTHAAALPHYVPYGIENEDDDVAMHVIATPEGIDKLAGVAEFIIHDAHGEVVGTGRDGYIDVDVNQIYEIRTLEKGVDQAMAPDGRVLSSTMWDPARKVTVQRLHLYPVDEKEIEKADTTSAEFERLHPRDDDGKFAPKGRGTATKKPSALPESLRQQIQDMPGPLEQTPQEKPAKPSVREKPRLSRDKPRLSRDKPRLNKDKPRLFADDPAPEPTREKARPEKIRAEKIKAARLSKPSELVKIRAKIRNEAEQPSGAGRDFTRTPLFLTPDRGYQVHSDDTWSDLVMTLSDEELKSLHHRTGSVKLNRLTKRAIAEGGSGSPRDAYLQMGHQVDQELVSSGYEGEPDGGYTIPGSGEMSEEEILANISSIMNEHPGVVAVNIIDREDGSLEFSWVQEDVSEQIVIDVPDDFNPDEDYQLTYVGTFEARDMYEPDGKSSLLASSMEDTMGVGSDGMITNPRVRAYKVDRYRVDREG